MGKHGKRRRGRDAETLFGIGGGAAGGRGEDARGDQHKKDATWARRAELLLALPGFVLSRPGSFPQERVEQAARAMGVDVRDVERWLVGAANFAVLGLEWSWPSIAKVSSVFDVCCFRNAGARKVVAAWKDNVRSELATKGRAIAARLLKAAS